MFMSTLTTHTDVGGVARVRSCAEFGLVHQKSVLQTGLPESLQKARPIRRIRIDRQTVIGSDCSGCIITYAENLQGISTEIPDRLEFGFKPVISGAAKHTAVPCGTPTLNPRSLLTRICAEAKSSKGRQPWLLRPAFPRPPACCRCSATTSTTPS